MAISFMIYRSLSTILPGYGAYADNTPAQITTVPSGFSVADYTAYQVPSFDEIQFASRDPEVTISGWFCPTTPAADVVILVHGINDSKADPRQLVVAGLLHQLGMNVLLIDLQNHGKSSITNGQVSLGRREYLDVLGAKDWLLSQGFSGKKISLYGFSLGAAVSVITTQHDPEFPVLFLDSPYSNTLQVVREELARFHLPSFFLSGGLFMGNVIFRNDLMAESPDNLSINAVPKRICLAHSREDTRVLFHHSDALSEQFKSLGSHVQTHFYDRGGHAQLVLENPELYRTLLQRCFGQIRATGT